MEFTNETKVRDIALSSPVNRNVLEAAGVDYCCGGAQSLREACGHAGAPADEILARLRENAGQTFPGGENWQTASLAEMTRHIREKHHRYVREAIPRVRALLGKVIAKHGQNHGELAVIGHLFHEVDREMIMHMQKEEQILFPYIDAMEKACEDGIEIEPPFFQTVRNPISAMMKEHDATGEVVRQIRIATLDYAPPAEACTSYKALYDELKQFEADLHLHVHLENNILFPRALDLERASV